MPPNHAEAGLSAGDSFPDLNEFQFDGQLPKRLKGKIVLVDFWASWCGPCKQSFPVMEEIQKKYSAAGLVIIAISEDEKKSDMEDFLNKKRISFVVLRDAASDGKKLVDKVGISGMPSSFILDGDGKVRFAHTGFNGSNTKKKYEQEIEALLKK